jgi:MFS family permease
MRRQLSEDTIRGRWMALAAALLGWMFDGLEQGLFPLVARPALKELLGGAPAEQTISLWFAVATAGFLVGAATGGVLFGWLGDRVGRVRAMTFSVLTYAVFGGLCGLAAAPWQVVLLRFFSALGMGGEWSLGVALVMEIWQENARGVLAGLIGAAANVGFLLIAALGRGLSSVLGQLQSWLTDLGLAESWTMPLLANSGWRLLLLCGAAPALLTFFIRLFVPESQRWQSEQSRGGVSHWATRDLLGVLIGALGACLVIYVWAADFAWSLRLPATALGLLVATSGYIYPVIRYMLRARIGNSNPASALKPTILRMLLGACLAGIPLLGTWGATQWVPSWADQLAGGAVQARSETQMASALGAILGAIAGAVLGKRLGRRLTYALLCAASLVAAQTLYQTQRQFNGTFLLAVFVVGATTASFYGWLPLYLPELFRTAVRATGQGFSFNFGRILAAIGVLQTGSLMQGVFRDDYPRALSFVSLIYLVGLAVIWLAPETRGHPLPE